MKIRKALIAMVLAVATLGSLTLQSCYDDDDIGRTLEGTWRGYMGIYSLYDNDRYQSEYSELQFSANPFRATSGTGYWIDYYGYTPWGRNYIANHFRWNVVNSVIYIHLIEEGTELMISQYRLTDDYFEGIIREGYYGFDDPGVRFSLVHVNSPNWDSFDYNYPIGYYAKPTRFIDSDSTETQQ